MSREEEKKVKGLVTILKGAADPRTKRETIEIKSVFAKELLGLMELLLSEKPIVLDEEERDDLAKAFGEMDKAGFGLD